MLHHALRMSYHHSHASGEAGRSSQQGQLAKKRERRYHYESKDPRTNEILPSKRKIVKTFAEVAVAEEAPELEPLLELLSSEDEAQDDMKKRGGRGPAKRVVKRFNGSRRRNANSGYMHAEKLQVRDIVPWTEMKGTKNRWNYHVTLASLITPFKNVYDEFRVLSLRVKFFSDAQEGGATGCYTGILMDQNGFGDFGAATGTAWFKSIGCFPGSVVKHRGENITLRWRPTEPDARQWRRGVENGNYVVASVYFADDGEQETEVGGTIQITGTVLARGRWYNVPTLRAERVRREMSMDSVQMGFENICHT